MRYKGITYDVGTLFAGNRSTRETFDLAVMRREIDIIKQDLHCNAPPEYDLDMASYGIVKVLPEGEQGTAIPASALGTPKSLRSRG